MQCRLQYNINSLCHNHKRHNYDVIMDTIASQITSLTIAYSTVYSDADQSKYQSSASLAFVREMASKWPHKWPVTRKMFPFDDVIMDYSSRVSMRLKTLSNNDLICTVISSFDVCLWPKVNITVQLFYIQLTGVRNIKRIAIAITLHTFVCY